MSRRFRRIVGCVALVSSLFWLITGMGWWSPILDPMQRFSEYMRGLLIGAFHVVGLAVGIAELSEPGSPR